MKHAWVACASIGSLTGCAFTWEPRSVTTTRNDVSAIRFTTATLPGRAELGADGVLRFTVDDSSLCQQDRLTIERRRTTRHYGFSGAGKVTVGVAGAVGVGGIVGAVVTDEPAPFAAVASVGLLTAGVILLIRYAAPNAPRQVQDTGDQPVIDATETVPCGAELAASYANLSVVTPWGAVHGAAVDEHGVASFAIDWLDTPGARDAIAAPWQLTSGALSTTYTPSSDDVEQILRFAEVTRDRVVVADQPAALAIDAFQLEGAGLVVGGTGLVTLTVANTGPSTAVDVVGKTRSTIKALDGVTFALGKIQPGRRASRTVTVKAPTKTDDDRALVKLTVSAAGAASVSGDLTIELTRSVCPAGGMSRETYDAKRKNLKSARDAGHITQEEFDRYDAELLSCLP